MFVYFLVLIIISGTINTSNVEVSIITSLYNGRRFLPAFLENISSMYDFEKFELIIIDANSTDKPEEIILPFLKKFKNIYYKKFSEKNSLYESWNIGIKMAQGKYITNANVDDLKMPDGCRLLKDALDKNSTVDVVYGNCFVTLRGPINFKEECDKINKFKHLEYVPGFNFSSANFLDNFDTKVLLWKAKKIDVNESMRLNPPGPMPMWRKKLHDKVGFFDPQLISVGDWEMWLRCHKMGIKFLELDKIIGIYYFNPQGLSTTNNAEILKIRKKEDLYIFNAYKEYFS